MAAVEQANLSELVGVHARDEAGPGLLPPGPAEHEPILDDPLPELPARHRPVVPHPHLRFKESAFLGGGQRSNSVYHGAREARLLIDPGAEVTVQLPTVSE